mmetsp:Transcript_9326/g.30311  ORF Transcript_9326/g.30311 Transcript_9326/m.30311 type:complete len:196 (-) Transcript_9326:53-640(-)
MMPVFGLTLLCLFALVAEGLVGPPFGGDGIDPKVFRDRDPYRPPQGSPAPVRVPREIPRWWCAAEVHQCDRHRADRRRSRRAAAERNGHPGTQATRLQGRGHEFVDLRQLRRGPIRHPHGLPQPLHQHGSCVCPSPFAVHAFRMLGAECMLALHLLIHYPPDGVVPATDDSPPLKVADFIDKDRLKVLRSVLPPK